MSPRSARYALAGAFALLLTLAQVSLLLFLAPSAGSGSPGFIQASRPVGWVDPQEHPGSALLRRYLRLNNWDSLHYWAIAQHGYRAPPVPTRLEDVQNYRASAAFFPAYPVLSRWVGHVLGVPAEVALLVTAQLFCFLFWGALALLLLQAGVPQSELLLWLLSVAIYPGSFYLVCGYSESVFLFALMGALLGVFALRARSRPAGAALGAGVLGALATGSRLVGAPLALLPAVDAWLVRRPRRLPGAAGASALAATGIGAFFALCYRISGHWDLYFRIQEIGWANKPDYLAILDPRSYLPRFFFEDTLVSIHRTSVLFCAALFVALALAERRSAARGAWRDRGAIYFGALALFYLSVAGKAGAGMDGMARYTLPVFALLVLAFARLRGEGNPALEGWRRAVRGDARARGMLALAWLLAFATQIWLAFRFLRGRWIS